MHPTDRAAEILAANRHTHDVIDTLPADSRPADLSAAYDIQRAVVDKILAEHGGHSVGYKIACTNQYAQQLLGIDHPLFGRLLSSFVHSSPAKLQAKGFRARVVETEFAFQMRADVPPQEIPYTHESIQDFIGAVLPSFEIVEHHFVDWTKVGGYVLAADNAIHGAWVHGEPVGDWREFDLQQAEVTLTVNGQFASRGCGEKVLGHPLAALAWLANELPRFELSLKEGDYVTTGTATEVYIAQTGDELLADFGAIGRVYLVFQ